MIRSFWQIAKLSTSASRPFGEQKRLIDNFGRVHDYLRVSLTEKCNLRCGYCMPAEGIDLTESDKCLSLQELKRLTTCLVALGGVRKIRLTGGEPTIDRKLVPLIEHLDGLRRLGLETIALTTNGLSLWKKALVYRNLGLDRVNISLDTLQDNRFERITRRKGLQHVLRGLDKALEAGYKSVKLNCVVMRDVNDDELASFVQMTANYPIEVRFIEFMPFFGNKWSTDLLVPYREMFDNILSKFPDIEPIARGCNETAKLFKVPGAKGTIGFITSMTKNFCSGCNRVRLTSDGHLKVCLLGRAETSLRDLMRNGATDSEIVRAVRIALSKKDKQHAGMSVLQGDVSRPMIKIESFEGSRSAPSHPKDQLVGDGFSHLDSSGNAIMVDIGPKLPTRRMAVARGVIKVGNEVLNRILAKSMEKGDIIAVSKTAGIMAAKMTANLIPMCHQIPLDHVGIEVEPNQAEGTLAVTARVQTEHKTGVEMECLTAVSVTLLTIYDMCKSIGSNMSIRNIELLTKEKAALKVENLKSI